MQFLGIVNKYLHADRHARERRLCARNYAVVPIGARSGLIEVRRSFFVWK